MLDSLGVDRASGTSASQALRTEAGGIWKVTEETSTGALAQTNQIAQGTAGAGEAKDIRGHQLKPRMQLCLLPHGTFKG